MSIALNNEAVALISKGELMDGLQKLNLAVAQQLFTEQVAMNSTAENGSELSSETALTRFPQREQIHLKPCLCQDEEPMYPEVAKVSIEPLERYNKFIVMVDTPRQKVARDHHLIRAVIFYNLGLAVQRQSNNLPRRLKQALEYYRLANSAACLAQVLECGNEKAVLLHLAILTNMAQVYGQLWEPLHVHFCLRGIHNVFKDSRYNDALDPREVSFFVSNLTCACVIQWNLPPAA